MGSLKRVHLVCLLYLAHRHRCKFTRLTEEDGVFSGASAAGDPLYQGKTREYLIAQVQSDTVPSILHTEISVGNSLTLLL